MKKTVLLLSLLALAGCAAPAEPYVVNVYHPNDGKKSCDQLRASYYEAENFRMAAQRERGWRGDNINRWIFFFPAGLTTNSNAKLAIDAAERRQAHLEEIMKDKGCKKY